MQDYQQQWYSECSRKQCHPSFHHHHTHTHTNTHKLIAAEGLVWERERECVGVCMRVYACVCVCVREREFVCVCVCVCVCVWWQSECSRVCDDKANVHGSSAKHNAPTRSSQSVRFCHTHTLTHDILSLTHTHQTIIGNDRANAHRSSAKHNAPTRSSRGIRFCRGSPPRTITVQVRHVWSDFFLMGVFSFISERETCTNRSFFKGCLVCKKKVQVQHSMPSLIVCILVHFWRIFFSFSLAKETCINRSLFKVRNSKYVQSMSAKKKSQKWGPFTLLCVVGE